MIKKNIIIAILLIAAFLIASGVIYLNNVYLPVKVKSLLADELASAINYNVEIEKLKFSIIRGLVVENLAVYDGVKDKENTILAVPEASFHVLFFPLLKDRVVIIPILNINSPVFNIRYQKDKSFNFSKAMAAPVKKQAKEKAGFSFLVYKINITDAKGAFKDENATPEFAKNIEDLDIVLSIKDLARISFSVESKVATSKGTLTALTLRGDYNWRSKELNSKINCAGLLIHEFNPYLKMLPLYISAATADTGALELKFKDKLISLKGAVSLKALELRRQNFALTGDINLEPDVSYALDKREFDYKAKIKFIQVGLNGIPYVDKLSNISGDMALEKNKLRTDNLKMQAADSTFTMTGLVENFGNPSVKLDFKSGQVNLEKIRAFMPFETKGINVSGTASVDIAMEGYLSSLPLAIKANLSLNDCKLQAALLKEPLNSIKGDVSFTNEAINWQDLSFNYLGMDYASTGKLVNFQTPQIISDLKSKDLDLKSDFKIQDKVVRVITFKGKYLNSQFDVEGRVDVQDTADPGLDLSANLNLSPPDIFIFLPAGMADSLKKAKTEGILNIKGTLTGRIKEYKDWDVLLKVSSDTFSVYNLRFNGITFNFIQKIGLINIDNFTASLYSGLATLFFSADLRPDLPAYSVKFNGSGIDLEKLKLDTPLKDKDMAGLLNISAEMNGNFKDAGSLKGSGTFSIKDGRLWQINLFKGLGELFLIPDYEKIAFKEALGEFDIADKAISTENLKLTSKQLALNCTGKVGFDGTLDLTFYSEVNSNYIRDSADIRKFTTAVLGNLGNALTVKVSGTVQQPKYNIVPAAGALIKNIKDFILGK